MKHYQELLHRLKLKFTTDKNAEMVALIVAAEYQYFTLLNISESKIFHLLPQIASEALEAADLVAEKVSKNV